MNILDLFKWEKRDTQLQKNPLNLEIKDNSEVNYSSSAWLALEVNTIHACINVIAGAISGLPMFLYKRNNDGSRTRATGHRLFGIATNPNPDMTPMSFFYALITNLLLYGNAFIQKIETKSGLLKLNLIPSRYVTSIKIDKKGEIVYTVSMQNDDSTLQGTFTNKEILHIVGESLDGIHGKSPVELLHNTVEFAKILELYGKKYFENGASLTGVIETGGKPLSEEAAMRLRKAVRDNYSGLGNIGKIMILEDNYQWKQIQTGNDSSQFLQTKESMISEIARIFNVPLHLLQDTSKSTSWGSGIEQMGIDFVRFTLDVHIKRIEQAFNTLLDYKDRQKYYFEFNIDALLRGDQEARYRAYQIGLQCGFMSPNEIRQKENMPKIDGGDVYCMQLNQPPYAGADKEKYLESMNNGNGI